MRESYNPYDGTVNPGLSTSFLIIWGAIVLISLVAYWRIFQKAGKPGWASIIPIYNTYVLLKIVGKPGWWLLLFLIPLVNIYFGIKTIHLLSKSFGKDVGFTLGMIFLPFIFYPILAFSSATYLGPYGDPEAFAAHQGQSGFEFEQRNG